MKLEKATWAVSAPLLGRHAGSAQLNNYAPRVCPYFYFLAIPTAYGILNPLTQARMELAVQQR